MSVILLSFSGSKLEAYLDLGIDFPDVHYGDFDPVHTTPRFYTYSINQLDHTYVHRTETKLGLNIQNLFFELYIHL